MNNLKALSKVGEGKSKIIYTDGVSTYLEFKGDVRCSSHIEKYDEEIAKIRAQMTCLLFDYLSQEIDGVAKAELIEPKIIKMETLDPLPLEWIPRYIAAGSVVKRFGFKKGHVFNKLVLKIDYKTDMDDYLITDELIIEKGILNKKELEKAKKLVYSIAGSLKNLFLSKGLKLWDFKLELGINPYTRQIKLIDEISFDGMRLKDANTEESFDKDIYRETGSIDAVIKAYRQGFNRLFGVL
ncbi:MAG: phosphoribosylaminoimidazolesuccinocarboxamide synthase [Deltaproteobacteria bacterium]